MHWLMQVSHVGLATSMSQSIIETDGPCNLGAKAMQLTHTLLGVHSLGDVAGV